MRNILIINNIFIFLNNKYINKINCLRNKPTGSWHRIIGACEVTATIGCSRVVVAFSLPMYDFANSYF